MVVEQARYKPFPPIFKHGSYPALGAACALDRNLLRIRHNAGATIAKRRLAKGQLCVIIRTGRNPRCRGRWAMAG
jgi:hypothetical protein